MRGVDTNLTKIRRTVFKEVARIAYQGGVDVDGDGIVDTDDYGWVDNLPYEIIPGDVATYRESVFIERAVVGERIRLAMGLPLQGVDKPAMLSEGVAEAAKPETYYEPPLINVINFACNACEDKRLPRERCLPGLHGASLPRDLPQGRHLPVVDGKAHIDQEQVHQVRPLRRASAPTRPSTTTSAPAPPPAA